MYGLYLLLAAMGLITILITLLRLHAFLALVVTAAAVGFFDPNLPHSEVMPSLANHFGTLAGRIGIMIALAALIGECMLHSGAADKIALVVLRLLGERRASLSLLVTGHGLGIPVFFDTVFYLLIPLARSLRTRVGRNYLLYVTSIVAGGITAHCLVPPTPGPLAIAASLQIPLPVMFLGGLTVAAPMALVGWWFGMWLDRKLHIPFRHPTFHPGEVKGVSHSQDEALPGFTWAVAPIVAPVLLIAGGSLSDTFELAPAVEAAFEVLGDPNMALLVAAAIAMWVAFRHDVGHQKLAGITRHAFSSAGNIILITAAGGALGGMLGHAGVGESLANLGRSYGLPWLLLGFLVSALFKVAQGSSTVAMMATASLLAPAVAASPPSYPVVWLAAAIGAGSLMGEWMNDSAFWVYQQMGGFTEAETLRALSPLLAVMSLTGLAVASLFSILSPALRS